MKHLIEVIRRLPLAFVICIAILILIAEVQRHEAEETANAAAEQNYQPGVESK